MSGDFDNSSLTPVVGEGKYNQSSRAEAVLDQILHGESESQVSVEEEGVAVSEALRARPILDYDTGRTHSRLAFVTSEQSVLEEGSVEREFYLNLSTVFDEVHVLVLIPRRGNDSFMRAESNVWIYKVHNKNWWRLPWQAKRAANKALTFNGNIRPDIVVGVDPFEAGLGAYFIAKQFGRPFQLHVKTNPFASDFAKKQANNNWRLRIAKYLLKRTKSIRTESEQLKQVIDKRYKQVVELFTLPHFYNFSGLIDAKPTINLHEQHPGYAFIILAFGPLTADSHLHDLFTALRQTLLNQRIGLLVVGDGPAAPLFFEKVKLLGIEKSVIFQKKAENLPSYFKTADALVETGTEKDSEVNILRATAAGLPIIAVNTDLRADLFAGTKAAFLCPAGDLQCLSQRVSQFINAAALRVQFKEQLQDIAKNRLQENPAAYYSAICATIESVLVPPELPQSDKVSQNEESQSQTTTNNSGSG